MYLQKSITYIFFISVFLVSFYLFYHMSLNLTYQTNTFLSDYPSHIRNLINIFHGDLQFPYPIWHYLVQKSSIFLPLDIITSAAFVTASVVTIYAILIYKIIHYLLSDTTVQSSLLSTLITLILLIVGPLDLPNYNMYYILGQWSPNIWYSPTFVMLKPFALLATFFIVKTLQNRSFKFLFITVLAAILSVFAKPSFIIVFLPAILLFYLLRPIYLSKYNTLLISILFLSTIGSILFQYSLLFSESNVHILIDPYGVWSKYSPSIFLSLLLGLGFPLLYLLFYTQRVYKNDYTLLSWIMTIISITVAILFAESGERYMHGNFFWSYATSLNLLYIFSLISFIKYFNWEESKTKIILLILVVQALLGLKYLINIMQGGYAL